MRIGLVAEDWNIHLRHFGQEAVGAATYPPHQEVDSLAHDGVEAISVCLRELT